MPILTSSFALLWSFVFALECGHANGFENPRAAVNWVAQRVLPYLNPDGSGEMAQGDQSPAEDKIYDPFWAHFADVIAGALEPTYLPLEQKFILDLNQGEIEIPSTSEMQRSSSQMLSLTPTISAKDLDLTQRTTLLIKLAMLFSGRNSAGESNSILSLHTRKAELLGRTVVWRRSYHFPRDEPASDRISLKDWLFSRGMKLDMIQRGIPLEPVVRSRNDAILLRAMAAILGIISPGRGVMASAHANCLALITARPISTVQELAAIVETQVENLF